MRIEVQFSTLSWYKSLFLQPYKAILAGGIKIYTNLATRPKKPSLKGPNFA